MNEKQRLSRWYSNAFLISRFSLIECLPSCADPRAMNAGVCSVASISDTRIG